MKKIIMSVYAVAIMIMLSNVNAFCSGHGHVCGTEWIKQTAQKVWQLCQKDCEDGVKALKGGNPSIIKSLVLKSGIAFLSNYNGPLSALAAFGYYTFPALKDGKATETPPVVEVSKYTGEIFTTVAVGTVLVANEVRKKLFTTKKKQRRDEDED